jgi:hypothetical protein
MLLTVIESTMLPTVSETGGNAKSSTIEIGNAPKTKTVAIDIGCRLSIDCGAVIRTIDNTVRKLEKLAQPQSVAMYGWMILLIPK